MTTATQHPTSRAGGLGLSALLGIPGGALLGGALAAVVLVMLRHTSFPAFGNSEFTRALTTLGQIGALALVAAGIWLARHRPRHDRLALHLGAAGVSLVTTLTLAVPLAATKLYLHGISVDQAFRTQFLTRLTDSPRLADMAYADLPTYYPAGWFWMGGRFSSLLGLAGWEAYKPWAILSLAAVAAATTVWWGHLVRTDRALVVGLAATTVITAYGSPEPYGAVIALLAGPLLITAWAALHPGTDRGGRGATVAVTGALGLSAMTYTLYTGVLALAVVLAALVAALVRRDTPRGWILPARRLVIMGVGSGLLALVAWAPYLRAAIGAPTAESGTARHYLPESGATVLLPMMHADVTGLLCLIGTGWLVWSWRSSRRAAGLGLGVIACYLWILLSLAAVAAGTTLLGFRVEVLLTTLLATAGAFGVWDGISGVLRRARPFLDHHEVPVNAVRGLAALVLVIVGVSMVQGIPHTLRSEIQLAYTDTDGEGIRADRFPPGAESHYADIDRTIREDFADRPADELITLVTEKPFQAYFPYRQFQAISPHYANPLGDYARRAATIEDWASAPDAAAFLRALAASPWRLPDAFIFRATSGTQKGSDGAEDETYTVRLNDDVYPNNPNVRTYTVSFPASLFMSDCFTTHSVGPFVVITRHCTPTSAETPR